MRRRPHQWPPARAWEASVAVVALAYGVEPELLRAESRGRGPRPPRRIWDAKKMAVHLAVVVSGCDKAELARLIGFHRDTVASHCAEMSMATDADTGELVSAALERIVRASLERDAIAHLEAEKARFSMLEETTRELVSVLRTTHSTDAHPTKSGGVIRRKDDHGNVIDVGFSRKVSG